MSPAFKSARAYCPDPKERYNPYCNDCPHLIKETIVTARGNSFVDRTCSKQGLVIVRGG